MTRARKGSPGNRVRSLAIAAVVVAGAAFAIEGGEYGTSDLVRQRARERALRAQIDSLSRVVDSLRRYERRVETDPKLQERIAREEFGMVRGSKELLYRFADPDTPAASGRRAEP